jgi:hypothetical protein
MKFNKEYSLGALLILIIIMVIKPDLLGLLYNNMLGKLIFVAAIVFLTLKHTVAGLIAVVFVALVASMNGYTSFEGMTEGADTKKECPDGKCSDSPENKDKEDTATTSVKEDATEKINVADLLKQIKQ